MPIYGQKAKSVQLVVNCNGKNRFGSVSFSLRKLQQGAGQKFIQWVTLYDCLDDDLFEGDLGEDEPDLPRILVEFKVVNSKYTSTVQTIQNIRL